MDRVETGDFVHRKVVRQPQVRDTAYKVVDLRPQQEQRVGQEKGGDDKEKVRVCLRHWHIVAVDVFVDEQLLACGVCVLCAEEEIEA